MKSRRLRLMSSGPFSLRNASKTPEKTLHDSVLCPISRIIGKCVRLTSWDVLAG